MFFFIIVFLYYSFAEANNIYVQHVSVQSDKIKNNYTLLHLSDFHLHKGMNGKLLESLRKFLVEIGEKYKIDIALLTGDLIDNDSGIEILPEVLRLINAKKGTFAVLGNHDYFQYNLLHIFYPIFFFNEKKPSNVEYLKGVLKKWHVKLLIDEKKTIRKGEDVLDIWGIDSRSVKSKALPEIKVNKKHLTILLSHYPDVIRHYKNLDVDILLSGHTHGGQITVFGYPVVVKSKIKKSQARGASIHKKTILYVTKGIGGSKYFPFRFFAKPEISMIFLRREAK